MAPAAQDHTNPDHNALHLSCTPLVLRARQAECGDTSDDKYMTSPGSISKGITPPAPPLDTRIIELISQVAKLTDEVTELKQRILELENPKVIYKVSDENNDTENLRVFAPSAASRKTY